MKVLGAEVARWMRSAAARDDAADLLSARKGYCEVRMGFTSLGFFPWVAAVICEEGTEVITNLKSIKSFCLFHGVDIPAWPIPNLLMSR